MNLIAALITMIHDYMIGHDYHVLPWLIKGVTLVWAMVYMFDQDDSDYMFGLDYKLDPDCRFDRNDPDM